MVDVLFNEGRFDPNNLLSFSSPMLTEVDKILYVEDPQTQNRLFRELTIERLRELHSDDTDKFLGEGIEEGFIGSKDMIVEMPSCFSLTVPVYG